MQCQKCSGNMYSSSTTLKVQLEAGKVIVNFVPCFECESCHGISVKPEMEKMVNDIAQNVKDVIAGDYEISYLDATNP